MFISVLPDLVFTTYMVNRISGLYNKQKESLSLTVNTFFFYFLLNGSEETVQRKSKRLSHRK